MAAEPKSLDIAEKQVLIDYWDDPAEFYWHHRILLLPTQEPGRWVTATPDYSVETQDLSEHRIIPVQRNAEFPADYRGYIYCFDTDDCSEARIEVMRRQARALAEIMSGGVVRTDIPDGATWRVSDTAHSSFGMEIPTAIIGDADHFVTRGKTGLVAFDPEDEDDPGWVTAELVVQDELDKWRQSKQAGAGRDLRLIGDIRVSGSREVTFLDAFARSKQVPTPALPGWPHAGERGAHEFMRGLKLSGLEWISHHNDFIAKSGISRGSGICRSHRRISESLALMMQWDQIDLCNSAAAECLIRFLIAIETAVRRNPRAPDFTLFDEISGQGLDEVGGVTLPGYTKWLADVQRDKAQVLKQQRLWSEEQGKWGKTDQGGGGGGGGGGGSSAAPPKGKPKGKGRGGRGGGADADP